MGESNDDFGLSLSLGLPPPATTNGKNVGNGFEPTAPRSFPLNLLHPRLPFMQHRNLHSSSENGGGIDINQPVTASEYDDNAMASSPHSTASTVTGKRSEREYETAAEAEAEMATSSMEEDDAGDDAAAAAAARKKLRLSKEQAAVLEDTFRGHNTLNPKQKVALAKQLNLKPRQVEVWFQNRRARTKLKQTEIDCEYLRRCCERLADENRRLHKEVNDLRALKLSPQLYMNMSPPTTLIMCPQCQRAPLSSPPPTSSTSSSCAATMPPAATVHRHQPAPPGLIQSWTAILQPQPHRPQL
ncbi:PREDICTED: homeobox-leucine zipper protein HAT4-like [Ipomoea nil]|uniref:homeobox-leucine zipper protein HAT4-like n=1 Tax=Ipomoea nil TaxID=35883 RepID=UPI000901A0BF|nr:PREDICTED: homeobox-leucine zipper protein HAT4-like [Ipomoea nil]